MDACAFALLLLFLLEWELKIGFAAVTIRISVTFVLQMRTISCCGLGQCFQHGACGVAMATNAVVRFAVRQPTSKPFTQYWTCSPAQGQGRGSYRSRCSSSGDLCRALVKKLIVANLSGNSPRFVQPECSFPWSQERATGPCREPDKSNPNLHSSFPSKSNTEVYKNLSLLFSAS